MSSNDTTSKQISYTEFFRKRLKQHDVAVKNIILEIKVPAYRKKRNYQEAFIQGSGELPPYTRFTDELDS